MEVLIPKSGMLADHSDAFSGRDRFFGRKLAIMTEDMGPFVNYALTSIFGDNLPQAARQQALTIARESLPQYQAILRSAFPGRDWVIRESDISRILRYHIERNIQEDPNVVIVINDRYIGQELDVEFPDNIFRFSSTRVLEGANTGTVKSTIRPRPGDADFETQLDQIEARLQTQGRSLKGAHVIIADDVNVKSTTEESMAIMFSQRGALVNRDESIYIYKVFTDEVAPEEDRQNSAGKSEVRVASMEERELTPLGGPTRRVGEFTALQQPAQAPFGDGGITRTNGFIHQTYLSRLQLELFLSVFGKIEDVLKEAKRIDGSTFEYFSFADFKWMIPVSGAIKIHSQKIQERLGLIDVRSLFGPSAAIRDFRDKNDRSPKDLAEVKLFDYIRLALAETKNESSPKISCVVTDIDGTQLKMIYEDPTKKSFRYSELGKQLRGFVWNLLVVFAGEEIEATKILESYDIEKPVEILKGNPEFAKFLVAKYKDEVFTKLKERFTSFYGNRGGEELQAFLSQHDFLSEAYHILRELTWGQIDYDKVYRQEEGQAAQFSAKVLNQGGTLIFLTASPRIHAMRVLELTGQTELVRSGRAYLFTVEDLYHPATLEEQDKIVFFKALDQSDGISALDLFMELANNNEKEAHKQHAVYFILLEKLSAS
ncbi:hypothetical protein HZB96_05655, partial [Candidatus Gottesmanbacteria bacterium]|nr:hypothetical protein [Candidatus Gottesmanbacteria bacterium]